MSLGQDVAAALPQMQAEAESLQVEACVIKRVLSLTADPATGADVVTYAAVPVYMGRCRVVKGLQSRDAESGASSVTVISDRLDLPVTAPSCQVGDVAFLTGGRVYRITGLHDVTWQSARRLPVERVD